MAAMKNFVADIRFMVKDWFASRGESVKHDDPATRILREGTHTSRGSTGFGGSMGDATTNQLLGRDRPDRVNDGRDR